MATEHNLLGMLWGKGGKLTRSVNQVQGRKGGETEAKRESGSYAGFPKLMSKAAEELLGSGQVQEGLCGCLGSGVTRAEAPKRGGGGGAAKC